MNNKTLIEAGALRQFKHNDASEGFVTAYDFDIVNRIAASLERTNADLLQALRAILDSHDDESEYKAVNEAQALIEGSPNSISTAAEEGMEPVEGDLLPPVGSKVLIHLGRQDSWVEHTVSGYYVWPACKHQVKDGEQDVHRVFVRVKDAKGYDNARLLSDVRVVNKDPK